MADVGPVFLDTSTIVAGLIDFGAQSASPQSIMKAIANGRLRPHTAWHCCLEFYAVVTRLPEEWRLSSSESLQLLEDEILGRFRVHQLPSGERMSFFRAAAGDRIVGGRIYDGHIAEIARGAGAKVVVTENVPHFTSLLRHGVRVINARALVDEMGF